MAEVFVPLSVFDCPFLPAASHSVPLYTLPPSKFSGVTRAGFQKAHVRGSCLAICTVAVCRDPSQRLSNCAPSVPLAVAIRHLQGVAKAADAQTRGWEDLAV